MRPPVRTSRALEVAQLDVARHNADVAAARYRQLRAAAAAGAPGRRSLRSWQLLLLMIFGGGVVLGVLFLWLLATMYLGYVALLALLVIGGLAALLVVRFRGDQPVRRPVVEDLVRALQEMKDAEAVVERLQASGDTPDTGSAPAAPSG